MTPTETTAILRQFNAWHRGDEDIPQFDPRDIGEAIDAAVEMIDRLEAAEKERDDLLEALKNIEEYWNQDQNETAMADACWHAINTARAAITRATGEEK